MRKTFLDKETEIINAFSDYYSQLFIDRYQKHPTEEEQASIRQKSKQDFEEMKLYPPLQVKHSELLCEGNAYLKTFVVQTNSFINPEVTEDDREQFIHDFPYFRHAKIFKIDEQIKTLLELTNNKITKKSLPFYSVFIDTYFDIGGLSIQGLLLVKQKEDIFCSATYAVNDTLEVFQFTFKLLKKEPAQKRLRKAISMLRLFVVNFLDFINDPEVAYVVTEKSEKSNQRRLKQGKIPMPSQANIILKDTVRRYIDSISIYSTKTFHCRFWVRGHFRTLKSDIYKVNKGKRVWILPYIKGNGILIEKEYRLNPSKTKEVIAST